MRAHLVQMDIAWEDKGANFARVGDLLGRADVAPGDLVLLPEMFDTGFSLEVSRTADTDGRTLAFLRETARTARAFVQGGRTMPGSQDGAHNLATCVGPQGELLAEYAKVHPFTFGREGERFAPGRRVMLYEWRAGDESLHVCPAVCYDLRFPELFRIGLGMGAEVMALGANWPEARHAHWRTLLLARAVENQAFVLGVNRVGADPHLRYRGGSIAIDPRGEVLGELGDAEGVLTVELDVASLRAWRETFPAWRDARLFPAARPRPSPDG